MVDKQLFKKTEGAFLMRKNGVGVKRNGNQGDKKKIKKTET